MIVSETILAIAVGSLSKNFNGIHAKSHASRVRLMHFLVTHAFPPAWNLSHAFLKFSIEKKIQSQLSQFSVVSTAIATGLGLNYKKNR